MVNEYTYCPRLAYLEWVQGECVGDHAQAPLMVLPQPGQVAMQALESNCRIRQRTGFGEELAQTSLQRGIRRFELLCGGVRLSVANAHCGDRPRPNLRSSRGRP